MALKPDRWEFQTDISFFCNSVSDRGVLTVHNSSGSGAAMDDGKAIVAVPTGAGVGLKPAGLLLTDVVDIDTKKYHLNFHKNQVNKGSKVTLGLKGHWVTNKVLGTPVAGDAAYLGASGNFAVAADGPQVGTFRSSKDQDGYAKVEINLP